VFYSVNGNANSMIFTVKVFYMIFITVLAYVKSTAHHALHSQFDICIDAYEIRVEQSSK
jgi:hypothetical protein